MKLDRASDAKLHELMLAQLEKQRTVGEQIGKDLKYIMDLRKNSPSQGNDVSLDVKSAADAIFSAATKPDS